MSFSPEAFIKKESIEKTKKLKNFVESAAAETRNRYNIPLLPNGRIDMQAFASVYKDIFLDNEIIKNWQQDWYGTTNPEEIENKALATDGEKLEMLAYAIFYKKLNNRFIVARSSVYDDIKNKADTLILDRETGGLVCAFDEVGDTSGAEYQRKQKAVLERNRDKQGVNLKYGLRLEKNNDEMKFSLGEVRNVPIFYIALPKDRIEKGIANFLPSEKESSEFEERLFQYFIASIDAQIKGLELFRNRLDEKLLERLREFGKMVENLKSKSGP